MMTERKKLIPAWIIQMIKMRKLLLIIFFSSTVLAQDDF